MMTQGLHCPYGDGTAMGRHGKSAEGKQRYRYRPCPERGRTFLLAYSDAGQSPIIKQHLIAMALNANGMRDTVHIPRGLLVDSRVLCSPVRLQRLNHGEDL